MAEPFWDLRGFADRLVGGPGMRRGRRHPDRMRIGDAVDFFRVEAIVPNRLVRLRAEMRVPGEAWLEWTMEPTGDRAPGSCSGPGSARAACGGGRTGTPSCRSTT